MRTAFPSTPAEPASRAQTISRDGWAAVHHDPPGPVARSGFDHAKERRSAHSTGAPRRQPRVHRTLIRA